MKYEILKDITENRPQFIPGTPEELDAVSAAPDNHIILFENELLRVIKVIVRPGEMENLHTHKYPCIFQINNLVKTEYHDQNGNIIPRTGTGYSGMMIYVEPEGIHQVKNIDKECMEGIRFEIKDININTL